MRTQTESTTRIAALAIVVAMAAAQELGIRTPEPGSADAHRWQGETERKVDQIRDRAVTRDNPDPTKPALRFPTTTADELVAVHIFDRERENARQEAKHVEQETLASFKPWRAGAKFDANKKTDPGMEPWTSRTAGERAVEAALVAAIHEGLASLL